MEWMSAILDAIPAEIAVLDGEGIIIYVNRQWCRFADQNQATPSCFEGANYLEICRSSALSGDLYARQAVEALELLLGGAGESRAFEYPCDSPDGLFWFHMILGAAVLDGQRFIIVQHIDITDRVEAEQRYQHIVNSVAEGIVVTDEDGLIVSANPAAENLFARTSKSMESMRIGDLVGIEKPQSGLRSQCFVESALEGKQTLNIRCFPFVDRKQNHFVFTLTDVSALERERDSSQRERGTLNHFKIGDVPADQWNQLRCSYTRLLDSLPASITFGKAIAVEDATEAFVSELHGFHVSPSDFVRLHSDVLYSLQRDADPGRSRTLTEESRLMLVRVVTELGSLYHAQAPAAGA